MSSLHSPSPLSLSTLFEVKGKKVLLTGGGRGIGLMIAQAFVENGATVFIVSRSAAENQRMAAELNVAATKSAAGGHCVALPAADLSKGAAACDAVIAQLSSDLKVKSLDVLINNSGVTWGEPMESYSEAGWEKVMNVNVKSIFYLTRAALPLLEAAASPLSPARVINISSIAGIKPQLFPTYAYDLSKAAVIHLTKKLASDFAPLNITVNAIAPGLFPSKMSNQLLTYAPKEMIESTIPLSRAGTPEDIAGVVLLLSSRGGAWITGDTIVVDGGALINLSGLSAKL